MTIDTAPPATAAGGEQNADLLASCQTVTTLQKLKEARIAQFIVVYTLLGLPAGGTAGDGLPLSHHRPAIPSPADHQLRSHRSISQEDCHQHLSHRPRGAARPYAARSLSVHQPHLAQPVQQQHHLPPTGSPGSAGTAAAAAGSQRPGLPATRNGRPNSLDRVGCGCQQHQEAA